MSSTPASDAVPTQTKPKSRLGRGLSSLISVSELPVEVEVKEPGQKAESSPASALIPHPSSVPAEVPIDSVTPNPHQPRRQMNDGALAELAASLKSTGVIQPIIVRKVDTGYQLIAGERRLRAAKLAGLKTIPAIIRDVDSFTQAQMALIENIQREDLNPIDRANAYRSLMTQLGLTQSEMANRLGEDRSAIAHFVRLLDLAEPVREMVRASKLSLGHAKLLAGVSDILEQQRIAELCVTQDLTVRNLERLLTGNAQNEPKSTREPVGSAHLQDLEKTIARQLGMRVQVRSGRKGKGRLTIHYASLDQFDDLLRRMGVKVE